MKKLFGVIIAAVMMAGGLVSFAMSPASAACPYSGCVTTFTSIDAPKKVEKGDKAQICVSVGTDGNGRPKGQVSVTVIRSKGGFKFVDTKNYNDKKDSSECFTTPDLDKRGNYIVKAKFDREAGSRWRDSDNTAEFRVVRRG